VGGDGSYHITGDVTISGGGSHNIIIEVVGVVNVRFESVNVSIPQKYTGSALILSKGSEVNLELSGTSRLTGSILSAGIGVPEGSKLTISGSSSGFGRLEAGNLGYGGGGIGGGKDDRVGTIIINGGTIVATGSDGQAGIGGGSGANSYIEITGGNITASGLSGIAIGERGGRIKISGGVVKATGTVGSADIGLLGTFSKLSADRYSVVIDGGDVKASVVSTPRNSAGSEVVGHEIPYALGTVDGIDVELVAGASDAFGYKYGLHDVPSGGIIKVWSPVEPPLDAAKTPEPVILPSIDLSAEPGSPDAVPESVKSVHVELHDTGKAGSLGPGRVEVMIVNTAGPNPTSMFSLSTGSIFSVFWSGGADIRIPVDINLTSSTKSGFTAGTYHAELWISGRSGYSSYVPISLEVKNTSVRKDNIGVRMLEYDDAAGSYKTEYVSNLNPVERTYEAGQRVKLRAVDKVEDDGPYSPSHYWYTANPAWKLRDWLEGDKNTPSTVLRRVDTNPGSDMEFEIIGAGRGRVELRAYDAGTDLTKIPSDTDFGGFLDNWVEGTVPAEVQYIYVSRAKQPTPLEISATIDGETFANAGLGTVIELTAKGGDIASNPPINYEIVSDTPGMLTPLPTSLFAKGASIVGQGHVMWYTVTGDGSALIRGTQADVDDIYEPLSAEIEITVSKGELSSATPRLIAAAGAGVSSVVGSLRASADIPKFVYAGDSIVPSLELSLPAPKLPGSVAALADAAGIELSASPLIIPSSQYDVVWSGNVNVGTASGTVSAVGGGSFAGSLPVGFEIVPASLLISVRDTLLGIGSTLPDRSSFRYDITGIVGRDLTVPLVEIVDTSTLTFTLSPSFSPAIPGDYAISVDPSSISLKSSNYTLEFAPGTLGIRDGELGVTPIASLASPVWSEGSTLVIRSLVSDMASIYDLGGTLVRKLPVSVGTTTTTLPVGIYVIVLDGTSYKVSID
jgi:hypothetical protein